MATDFAVPPLTTVPSLYYGQTSRRQYNVSGGAAPRSSTFASAPSTPTTSASPQSPLSSTHSTPQRPHSSRQSHHQPINQRHAHRHTRSPLYVPAVLRPTECLSRQSPPKSSGSSVFEHADGSASPGGSLLWSDGGWRRVMQGGCDSSVARIVGDEWNDQALGQVTGPPTRNHWKPDSCAIHCQSPGHSPPSTGVFTMFRRRHHCRRCGNIFCSTHAVNSVPLDQHARFHPEGTPQRACDSCWSDYKTWMSARADRASRSSGSGSGSIAGLQRCFSAKPGMDSCIDGKPHTIPEEEVVAADPPAENGGSNSRPITAATQPGGAPPLAASLAASVPRDWSW